MAVIQDHVAISAVLQTASAPVTTYEQLFLAADCADVPHDLRSIWTTKSSYTDDLTSSTNAYNFAAAFWAQSRTATRLMVGFWAETDQENFVVFPGVETTIATWVLKGATAYFKVAETGGATVQEITVTGLDAVTTLAAVAARITAGFVATGGSDYESYTCTVDPTGRFIITSDDPGAANSYPIVITAGTTGTDISDLLVPASAYQVAGLDAETPAAALAAISAIDDDYYYICYRGANGTGTSATSEQTALSTAVQSMDKLLVLHSSDVGCVSAVSTSDIAYVVDAAKDSRTAVIYSAHTANFPDARVQGCVIPADEGTTSWAWQVLSGANESGLAGDGVTALGLTTTQRTALKNKNCNWIESAGGSTYMYNGVTANGNEIRVMLGRDWFVNGITGEIFTDMLNSPLNAFDNSTLAKFEGIVRTWLDAALARRIIIDTEDRPITIDFPDADDFTTAQRASHTMTLSDVFVAYLNSAVNDVAITGTFTI